MSTAFSFSDSLPEFSSSVEVDVLEESEISVRTGAGQLGVPPEALRAFAQAKKVLDGDYLPLEDYRLFAAAMSLWRRTYYDEKLAIAKIGNRRELNRLVNIGKIRVKFYHTMTLYHREDVEAVCKPAISVKSEKRQVVSAENVRFVPGRATRRPVTTDRGAKVTGAQFFIDGEEYISIAEAARILKEKVGTVWQWVHKENFLPFITVKEDWVKLAGVQAKLQTPFFQRKRYSFTAVGDICKVTRSTVAKWTREDGVVCTPGPGGQKYVLADQLTRCAELAERAQQFNHRKSK